MGSVPKVPQSVSAYDGARPRQQEAEAHRGELLGLMGRLKERVSWVGQHDGQGLQLIWPVGALDLDLHLLRDKARLCLLCLAWSAGIGKEMELWCMDR